jgi:hypothetical protein
MLRIPLVKFDILISFEHVLHRAGLGLQNAGSGQARVGLGLGSGRAQVGLGSGSGRAWVGLGSGSGSGQARVELGSGSGFILWARAFCGPGCSCRKIMLGLLKKLGPRALPKIQARPGIWIGPGPDPSIVLHTWSIVASRLTVLGLKPTNSS